jgi:CheY-like chemotaxis protein/anti-sigma regulatory factor (Ser/Thr protein kinase)
MSHELRTPLNGILGYAQIMQRDRGLDDKHDHGVRIIRESGEHLLALINDILDMAKIEAGKLELAQAAFGPQSFFDGLVDLFRIRAKEKALGFQVQMQTELPEAVQGDERRLRQVCFNLLSNAFKFTDTGTITLEVGYADERLRVCVEDEGCGIATDEIDEIFEPFQQTGHAGNRAQGTGLGLPISKHLVEAMGGRMQVHSRLGQGSRFAFEVDLPRAQASVPEASTAGRTILGFEGDECRILVVDDREHNRVLLMDLLAPLGFSVEGAVDGEEALTAARRLHPRLILLDLLMPVMDGFECARRLRQCPEFEGTVIIAVSASVLDQQIHEAFAAGCDAFLPKPIQADALFGEIAKRLGLQWRYAEEADGPAAQARSEADAPQEIIPPPQDEIVELLELATQGDILGVVDYVEARFEGNTALGPFAQRVQRLAEGFRERELIVFLESFSDDRPPE